MDIFKLSQWCIVIRDQDALATLRNLMLFLWLSLSWQIDGYLLHFCTTALPVTRPTDQPRQQTSNCKPQGAFCYMNKIQHYP